MKTHAERLVYAFRAARVKRWHTHSYMIYEDTVGHHSHGVAMILLILHPDPSANLLKAALLHDLGEKKVGDMSHWVKKDNPELAMTLRDLEADAVEDNLHFEENLTADDRAWLKAADALHAWMVLRENVLCGNQPMSDVQSRLGNQIFDKVQNTEWPKRVLDAVHDMLNAGIWFDY